MRCSRFSVHRSRFGKSFLLWVMVTTCCTVQAKVDLVTLPEREGVQVTIYNSADLTLVRESRFLTLREGLNKLQFSWENTLIDPTSLSMIAKEQADKIDTVNKVQQSDLDIHLDIHLPTIA